MPFIRTSKGVHGPFSAEKLKALHRQGRLPADAEYSNTANGPWRKVPTVPKAPPETAGTRRPDPSISTHSSGAIAVLLTLMCAITVGVATVFFAFPDVLRPLAGGVATNSGDSQDANGGDAAQRLGVDDDTSTAATPATQQQYPPTSTMPAVARTETSGDSSIASASGQIADAQLDSGPRPEALDTHMAKLKDLTRAVRSLADRCKKKDVRAFLFLTLSDTQYQWLREFDNRSIAQQLSSIYDWTGYSDAQGQRQDISSTEQAFQASVPFGRHEKLGLNTTESKQVLRAESDLLMSLQGGESLVFGGAGWMSEARQFFPSAFMDLNRALPKLRRGETVRRYEWVNNESGQFDDESKDYRHATVEVACVRFGQMVSDSCERLDTLLDKLMNTPKEKPAP
jgi:hypothetical protein